MARPYWASRGMSILSHFENRCAALYCELTVSLFFVQNADDGLVCKLFDEYKLCNLSHITSYKFQYGIYDIRWPMR